MLVVLYRDEIVINGDMARNLKEFVYKNILWGTISRNLRHPKGSVGGHIAAHIFETTNAVLEVNAADLCNIRPGDTVLEVGFGPGIGIQAAYERVKAGRGTVHGVEISEQMLAHARNRLKSQLSTGQIHLHDCSVDQMPFQANTFDCVFHVNCFYFWEDMAATVRELYRVMKPGARMVATHHCAETSISRRLKLIRHGNTDPSRYMDAMINNGFVDVSLQELNDSVSGLPYKAIIATVDSKV